jgi:hypothetical protein
MKRFTKFLALAFSLVTSLAGAARADDSALRLEALPAQNFAFCINTDATVALSQQLATEVGIVITNVGNAINNRSGTVAVAANNFYQRGAGNEWTSKMGQFTLPGGHCYNVAMMGKPTSPNGGNAWACALTTGSASNGGASISGLVSTQTQFQTVGSGIVISGVSQVLNNAPVVNCPY